MAQPGALQSRIRAWINAIELVEITDISVRKPKPTGFKFGPAGMIGKFKGQAAGAVQFSFAVPDGKAQFETFVESLDDFYLVFTKGSSKFAMTFCSYGDTELRGNYESGDTSVTATVVGTAPQLIG